MKPSIKKRTAIVLIECFLFSLFGTGCILSYSTSTPTPLQLIVLWFAISLGPITLMGPTVLGIIIAGINIACISAFLIRPNIVTGIISFLSVITWYFLGWVGVQMGV